MKNSLEIMFPEVAKQWSTRNFPLLPKDVSYGSNKKVWWRGECGHEWQASPHSRTGKNSPGCPYCSGNRVLAGFNDFASRFPEIAAEWSEKNYPLRPDEVTAFSNKKAWWKGKCGHEWYALISSRSDGHGCPYCEDHKLLKGFNDFASQYPQLAKEWSEKNKVGADAVTSSKAGLFWWQRDNLKAVHAATQHTSAELEEKLEENRQMIQEAVRSASEVTVREVTEEERQALRDGSMTQEQLMERLTGSGGGGPSQPDAESAVPASRPESGGKTDAAPETPDAAAAGEKSEKSAESSYQKELSALIAKVYVLREEYTLALDTMYADAKAEYLALPAEKRTTTQLAKMAKGYLSRANALEKECDGKMDEVIRAMETLIRDNNGDLTLVDTVVYTYANEKSLKKSWYMSKLEQKGLL